MDVALIPFSAAEHSDAAVEVLHRVRATDPTYPSPKDADDTDVSLALWLNDGGNYRARWVAMGDGQVMGHISVAVPHDYIFRFLRSTSLSVPADRLYEITKFFVDPTVRRLGIGTLLFNRALEFVTGAEMKPILAVVSTSTDARRFYTQHGLSELGIFEGEHGTNHVFARE